MLGKGRVGHLLVKGAYYMSVQLFKMFSKGKAWVIWLMVLGMREQESGHSPYDFRYHAYIVGC